MKFKTISATFIMLASLGAMARNDDHLIILHTNDSHSQIYPTRSDAGGVLRRKVLIDSVRTAEPNVLLIDAGDAVQGTLYFSLFGGEVERKVMNLLGYDMQILGNHEFDNGMDALVRQSELTNAALLSTNYDMSGTPLETIFKPYRIYEYGGRKIAFIAINLNPDGMISADNCVGVKYLDGLKAANSTAWHLKHNEKADMVIALTHIGYTPSHGIGDIDLATRSENIDIIIGGHSHTLLNPSDSRSGATRFVNAAGDTVLVAQAGALGICVGKIDIDLGNLKAASSILPVNSRLDSGIDQEAAAMLTPYRCKVDSVLDMKIGTAGADFTKESWGLINFISDGVAIRGSEVLGTDVDLAIMNKGGIRTNLYKGNITKGMVMQILPFDNRVVVIELKGSDLLEGLNVMAHRDGDGVSGNVAVIVDPVTKDCISVKIDGKELDADKFYKVATIDYLAKGGDYMSSFKNGKEIARSKSVLYDDFTNMFTRGKYKGKKIKPDTTRRMALKKID